MSSENQVSENYANSNNISGFYLVDSTNNLLINNIARFNTYEGIYLLNSSSNNLSENKVSSSYFGISLYNTSNYNNITENVVEDIYYYKVFNYSSTGNTIVNFAPEDIYNQTDIIRGVRLYLLVSTTALQTIDNATTATYNIVVENLGNMPDTFDLRVSSSDNPDVLRLDTDNVALGPHGMSLESGLVIMDVGDTEPGIYRARVLAVSTDDKNVSDSVETWTIVRSFQINETTWEVNSTVTPDATIMEFCTHRFFNK